MAQNFTPIDDLIKKYQNTAPVHTASNPTSNISDDSDFISLPKEAGPSRKAPESITIQETVEKEHIEEVVKPYVEVKKESIKIPDELKKLGLQPIEKTKFPDYKNIKLPISDDKIVLGLHAPVTSSLRWLSTYALYLLQQSHLTLKVVHGKAVRIIKK